MYFKFNLTNPQNLSRVLVTSKTFPSFTKKGICPLPLHIICTRKALYTHIKLGPKESFVTAMDKEGERLPDGKLFSFSEFQLLSESVGYIHRFRERLKFTKRK